MEVVVIPGFGGSGDAHWQTLWERSEPAFHRIQPKSWVQSDLADWILATDAAIARCSVPPILLAHSLGCLLVAHWAAATGGSSAAAAMLVAVPDPSLPVFPHEAAAFAALPPGPLPFPTCVVASRDDPFSSLGAVERQAAAWRAAVVIAGALGHINSESGLGEWAVGKSLLVDMASNARPSHGTKARIAPRVAPAPKDHDGSVDSETWSTRSCYRSGVAWSDRHLFETLEENPSW